MNIQERSSGETRALGGIPLFPSVDGLLGKESKQRDELRAFFRIDTEIFLRCRNFSASNVEILASSVEVNLSGGGISLIHPHCEGLQKGQTLSLEIVLLGPSYASITCLSEVVRSTATDEGQMVGLKFTRINDRDRDRIVGYCFAEQGRLLRRRVRIN